ncbi:MAG TPA: Wzz/FepE/Etk N-terminal domain-containing protein [Chloroflexota bacterium]|nr:Wzz/FepE/Etk N-terminal domain-containing protein [Chloroflexota bacterium]
MELRHYVQALLRRWPIVVLFAALAGGTAFAYSFRAQPVYRATAHLSVTPSVVDFFTGEAVQRLLNNYAVRLRTQSFAADLAPRLGSGTRAEDVAGKVRAVAAPSEFRISIEVDDADPSRAQQIANAAAYGFVEKIRAETAAREKTDKQDVYVEVMEPAGLPGAPFSPRPRRDALGGALVGALLAAVLALVLEAWDDSVKTVSEAQTLLGLTVLAAIPATHRSGVLDVFTRGRTAGRRHAL